MVRVVRALRWPAIAALLALASVAGGGSNGAAPASAQASTTVQIMTGSVGQYLADANGMTLYVFSADQANSGASACAGTCAGAWPPATVSSPPPTPPDGLMGVLDAIMRDDGSAQLTYGGMPLYRFSGDTSAGQIKGQNVTAFGGTWTAATP
ncbi:MAG TPA: hypothetical protein VK821_14205 [Dehalococcoidia bacterium]|nr:hypothetical protein [Dehalococcoidia bacterium]